MGNNPKDFWSQLTEKFFFLIIAIISISSIGFCLIGLPYMLITRSGYDRKVLLNQNDSLMSCYVKKIPLNTNATKNEIPNKKYLIFYNGKSVKYFINDKRDDDDPILGKYDGSFGYFVDFGEMIATHKKLIKGSMDFVFLIETKPMQSENIHYNKMRITTKGPFGQTLNTKIVDHDSNVTQNSIDVVCYLLDLKTLKTIAYQGFTYTKGYETASIVNTNSSNNLSSSQIAYLREEIESNFKPQ
jgi:hypothetical protein